MKKIKMKIVGINLLIFLFMGLGVYGNERQNNSTNLNVNIHNKLLPDEWNPKLEADRVLSNLIKVTAEEVKGAHDAEFVCVNNKAFIVSEVNNLQTGENPYWPFIYVSLSVVDLVTNSIDTIIPFAKGGQVYQNAKLPHGTCFVPRIIQVDDETLRCFFASEEPGKRQSQIWYIDFDIGETKFSNLIYPAKLKTSAGTYPMKPHFFYEDAVLHGFTQPAADFGFYIFDSFKHFKQNTYTALNNFAIGQNALAILNDSLNTFEIVGHFNKPDSAKLTESAITKLPDGRWMAICRREDGNQNYCFTTSEDGLHWTTGRQLDFVKAGDNSKPTFDKFNGIYYLGWQDSAKVNNVYRSIFNIDISKDGKTWERKYRFETDKSFQYPSLHEYQGSIYLVVTQGDSAHDRKERIMFGKLEDVYTGSSGLGAKQRFKIRIVGYNSGNISKSIETFNVDFAGVIARERKVMGKDKNAFSNALYLLIPKIYNSDINLPFPYYSLSDDRG